MPVPALLCSPGDAVRPGMVWAQWPSLNPGDQNMQEIGSKWVWSLLGSGSSFVSEQVSLRAAAVTGLWVGQALPRPLALGSQVAAWLRGE